MGLTIGSLSGAVVDGSLALDAAVRVELNDPDGSDQIRLGCAWPTRL